MKTRYVNFQYLDVKFVLGAILKWQSLCVALAKLDILTNLDQLSVVQSMLFFGSKKFFS